MRPLVHFFVLGALLLVAKQQLAARAMPASLTVEVSGQASTTDVERAIDEALLVEHALARGAWIADPVVRDQLLVAMRLDPTQEGDDDATIARARALGLHRIDPVIRQRLARQAEQLLVARAHAERPSDAALRMYLNDHRARYELPATVTVAQLFLSRARRGAALADDARALAEQLHAGRDLPHGDPTSLPRTLTEVTAAQLDQRFGPGFGDAVLAAPERSWTGPLPSSFGLHFVRIEARRPARLPALSEVRARLLADHAHDQRAALLRAQLRALRAQYRIHVARSRA